MPNRKQRITATVYSQTSDFVVHIKRFRIENPTIEKQSGPRTRPERDAPTWTGSRNVPSSFRFAPGTGTKSGFIALRKISGR